MFSMITKFLNQDILKKKINSALHELEENPHL